MIRKLDAMHREYGLHSGFRCKDCCNYVSGRYHDRILRKCAAYGLTHSEASDWRANGVACGLFGRDFNEMGELPMIERLKRVRRREPDAELDGQIGIFEIEEARP